jgi:hypothetical protein
MRLLLAGDGAEAGTKRSSDQGMIGGTGGGGTTVSITAMSLNA